MRFVDPHKILAFLQNPWFPPGTEKDVIDRYRNDVDFRRRMLAMTMTGGRLLKAFGQAYAMITWDNANPIHTPDPSGKVDPNPHYMAMRIMQSRPELVLTFGNNAKQGLELALQTLAPRHRVESMHCKHPNARFFPQHDLNLFAATVLTFQVPWDKNPRYNDTFHR